MGNSSKRRYDGKHRVTRILLADYQFVKQFSIGAGISMAEALHELIIKQAKPKPEPKPEREREPVTEPLLRVTPAVAFQTRPEPIIVTNGHKAGTLVIKPKGGVIQ